MFYNVLTLVTVALVLSSCEKMTLVKSAESEESKNANVVLRVAQFEQTPFPDATRASNVTGLCSRLNFLVYSQDGTRIRQENQKAEDDGFGEARFMLSEGHYFVVVLAHSSAGSVTSANAKNIYFAKAADFTDTFLYADSLIVGDNIVDKNLELHRIVSMVRFVFDDPIPAKADYIHFDYNGGSRGFDATNGGRGLSSSSISQQTQWYNISHTENKFEIFTIPRSDSSTLDVTVTTNHGSKDDADIVSSREIKGIPIVRNKITTCYGSLFSPVYGVNIRITIDDHWDSEPINFSF